jgi:RND family efflux transporter MFP subunit
MTIKWINSRVFVPILLAGGFAAVSYQLMSSPPQSSRSPFEYVVPAVEVVELAQGSFDVTVQAQGLIKASHRQVSLSAQVTGKIVAVHPAFVPGGLIAAGQTIIQIEQLDYLLANQEAKAKLVSAEAALAIEEGKQQIAEGEYLLGGGNISEDDSRSALALRKPQLNQVKSAQVIAQINYDKAKLALQRTALTMPYDVRVLEITSAIGEVVSVGAAMAELTRADTVWLELKVQQKQLARLDVKSATKAGSTVTFQSSGHQYQGQVISVRANLVSSTRMGGAIVAVANPGANDDKAPLVIGSYVDATIQAGIIANALKIPRSSLHNNNQIYVVDSQSKLQLRDTTIQWQLPDSLIIAADLQSQDRLIVSRVAGVAPGSTVNALAQAEQKLLTAVK